MRIRACGPAKTTLAALATAVMTTAGCADHPVPKVEPTYPSTMAAADAGSPFSRLDTGKLPYDAFDRRPVLSAPAFRPESGNASQEQLTSQRLADAQRATRVGGSGTARSAPTRLPLDGGVTAGGGTRTYAVGEGYWNTGSRLAWGAPDNNTNGPGTTVVGDVWQASRGVGGANASTESARLGPVTVPETLATDSESVGTGTASIPPPPDAKTGECFALVRKPALYRTTQRDFQMRPPADRLQVEPARYVTATQTVTTQDAYEKLEIVPATFHYVTEQVEVSPATTRYVASEPVYQAQTERVEERPARSVWKPGHGRVEKVDNATGQIMCLVEEPAVYRTVTRQVLKQQAEMREVVVPAQYRTVTRRVIDRPEQVRRVMVPAQQATLPVNRVVQEASYTRVPVPGQIASYGVKELVSPAELEWRPVLCETNMTADVVHRVQVQLTAAGFDAGPADGRMTPQTVAALNAYQRQRGLPEDRYLNVETARALGVWR